MVEYNSWIAAGRILIVSVNQRSRRPPCARMDNVASRASNRLSGVTDEAESLGR